MPEVLDKPEQTTQLAIAAHQPEELDLEELARQVAALLLRELQLENERTGKP
jgi:hypothetical protein